MKSIEFSSSSEAEPSIEQSSTKSLETLLLEKNRALQTENTQLKVANSELTGESFNGKPCKSHGT